MDKELKKLSDSIVLVRKLRGLNQDQLGELIGVKRSQVCKIESKPQDMRLSTIMRIVKSLNIELILTSDGVTIKSII